MKSAFRSGLTSLLVACIVGLLAGCATSTAKIWSERVGIYTFDQSVVELGPPDKQARLTDGTLVADWLLRRGYTETYLSPGYFGAYPHRPLYRPYPAYTETYRPDYFLRLVFGPDGSLKSWKRYAR